MYPCRRLFYCFASLFLLGSALPSYAQEGLLLEQDSMLLLRIYEVTGGRAWLNQGNWGTTASLDTWAGVTVDRVDGEPRVVGLELPANGLSGYLPPVLDGLSALERLDLRANALTGLPDTDRLPAQFNVQNNFLTLSDLLPLTEKFDRPEGFEPVPQRPIDTTFQLVKLGERYTLRPPVDADLDGQRYGIRYQWTRSGRPLDNDPNFETSPTSPELVIVEMSPADTGLYLLRIRAADSPLPELEVDVPVRVRALCEEEETTNCYVCGEYILDASGVEPDALGRFLEEEIADGATVDSCLCLDSLYLISFDNLDPDFLEARRDRAQSTIEPEGTELNIKKDNPRLPGRDALPEALPIDLFAGLGPNGRENPVRVGLVDSGTDQWHPLLEGYFWRNPNELVDSLDSDGNCVADDTLGYDFALDMGYPGPRDHDGHGTHLAGILASNMPRDVAMQIVDSKFLDTPGSATLFEAVCAAYYAMQEEAQVINLSWGYTGQPVDLLKRLLEATRERNVAVVSSAGNERNDNDALPHWPSNYTTEFENMISVAALKRVSANDFAFADEFSNFGAQTVDIAAPGALVSSTYPNYGFSTLSGTSMAAGFVTRALALMRALRPDLSAELVVECLLKQSTPLPSLQGRVRTGAALAAADALACALTDLEPVAVEERQPTIFPQPFHDRLRIDLSAWSGQAFELHLFSAMGRQILHRRLPAGSVAELQLSSANLPAGLYLYRLKQGERVWTGRLVRQPKG